MLARPQIEVVLRDRKKEIIMTQTGDDFLFGDRLAADLPLELNRGKWASRFEEQADDWQAAPGTWSAVRLGGRRRRKDSLGGAEVNVATDHGPDVQSVGVERVVRVRGPQRR